MFGDPKRDLAQRIALHLSAYPQDAPELLTAVAEGLQQYRDAVELSRHTGDRLAVEALVAGFRHAKLRKEFHVWLKAAYILFHKGNPVNGSDNDKWAWGQFLQSIGPDAGTYVSFWISGENAQERQARLTWWTSHVLPCLPKDPQSLPRDPT